VTRSRKRLDPEIQARRRAEILRERKQREDSYRERALKIYPHLCASCGREFEGRRLKELTVHHKDHDHDNNPPDGSNWELLCVYCHDHEHEKHKMKGYGGGTSAGEEAAPSIANPFDALDSLLPSDEETDSEEKETK
jgi:5-methylcytosine-specific restriction endonuclease McrA